MPPTGSPEEACGRERQAGGLTARGWLPLPSRRPPLGAQGRAAAQACIAAAAVDLTRACSLGLPHARTLAAGCPRRAAGQEGEWAPEQAQECCLLLGGGMLAPRTAPPPHEGQQSPSAFAATLVLLSSITARAAATKQGASDREREPEAAGSLSLPGGRGAGRLGPSLSMPHKPGKPGAGREVAAACCRLSGGGGSGAAAPLALPSRAACLFSLHCRSGRFRGRDGGSRS